MESLQNQTNVDNNNQNTQNATQEPKYKSIDNYISVFSHDFLNTLQSRLNALFVKKHFLKLIKIKLNVDLRFFNPHTQKLYEKIYFHLNN